MAKKQPQQEEPLEKLYTVLNEDELYTKSFDEFKEKYSTPEEVNKLYDVVSTEQYYTKDIDSFKEKYFPKSNDVSGDASKNTSETSTEASQTSQEVDYLAPENYSPTPIVNGGAVLAQTGEDSYGNVNLEDTNVTPVPLPKLGFTESVENTVSNIWTAVKSAIPQTTLAANQVISKTLGEDTLNWLNKLGRIEFGSDGITFVTGEDAETTLNKSLTALDELELETQRTVGTLGEIKSLPDLGAYVVDAVGSLASTVLISAPTAGSGLLTSMVGSSIKDYNKVKANRLGISEEELYKKGQADITTPLFTASLSYGLEKVGLKGVGNIINRGIAEGTMKSFLIVAKDFNQEGMTEWVQLGLDTYNTAIAEGLSVYEATKKSAEMMGSKQGLEVYAKGVVGSAVVGFTGRVGKDVLTKANRTKATELEDRINSSFEDLANDNVSQETKSVIAEDIANTIEELETVSKADNEKLDKLTPSQKQEIQEISGRLDSTEQSLKDPNLSDATRENLRKRAEYLSTELDEKINAKPTELTNEERIAEIQTIIEMNDKSLADETLVGDTRAIVELQNEQLKEELNTLQAPDAGQGTTGTNTTTETDTTEGTENQTADISTVQEEGIEGVNYVPTELDAEVQSEVVADTTFWQDLTNTESRATRLTTLEDRIKQRFKDSGNLGIASNSAKEQAKQMRDLTEYAILKITDGTIKTAQAFTDAVKGLGITDENVAKQAYYNATTSAEQYSKTNPELLSVQRRAGEIIVNIQEGRKSDATTKITAKTVKAVTEGGMKGSVTLTNKQALKTQISTLNRGIKEGIKQQKGTAKEAQTIIDDTKTDLQNVIKSMNTSEIFKGVKIPASTVQRLTANLNKAKTRTQLMRFTEDFQKFVDDVDYFNKIDKSRTLLSSVKKLARGKSGTLPADLKTQLRSIGNINPRYINDLDSFNLLLEDIAKYKESPTNRLREAEFLAVDDANRKQRESVKKQIEKASAEYQRNKIEALKEQLEAEGVDTTVLESIYDSNEAGLLEALENAFTASTNKESKADKLREVAKVYQGMIDDLDMDVFTAKEQELINSVKAIDINEVSDNNISTVVAGLANLVNNDSIMNLGRASVQGKVVEMSKNTKVIDTAKKAFRDSSTYMRSFVKIVGTGSMRIANNIANMMEVNAMNELTGYTDIKLFTNQAYGRVKNIAKDVEDIYKKFKKDFESPVDNFTLGIYRDVINFRESWDTATIEQEYAKRLGAWQLSLNRMKKEADPETGNKTYAKNNKNKIANLEKALAKFVGNGKVTVNGNKVEVVPQYTAQQVFDKLPQGLQEYSKLADKVFEALKEDITFNARAYNNIDLETDWMNYSPRMSQKLVESEAEKIEESANYGQSRIDYSTVSGSGENRTLSGNQLGDNRVLNPDFIGNFIPHVGKVIYDVETQPSRIYSRYATDIRTSPIVPKLGNKDAFSDYEGMIIQKTTQDEMFIGGNTDKSAVKEFLGRVQKLGVTLALGGLGQYVKQFIPPIADTSLRLKNKGAMATAMKLAFTDRASLQFLLSKGNIARRDVKDNLVPDSKASGIDPKELSKLRGSLSKLGMKASEVQEVLMNVSLHPLTFSDKASAEISWMAFYLDSLTEQNTSLDLETLNRKALDYADTMTSLVANESDPALKSNLSKSDWVRYSMPFMSFAFNSTADLAVNVARLSTSNDIASRKEAIRNISGNITAKVSFSAISAGIAFVTANTLYMGEQALVNYFVDDEEEKEELLELLTEEYDEKIKNMTIRRIGYAVTEIATGGIFSQVFEPVLEPVADSASLMFFTEEDVKASKVVSSKSNLDNFFQSLGLYGVVYNQLSETYKTGKKAFQSNEDFIKDRHGVVNSELTDIVVNDYRLSSEGEQYYGRPEFSRYTNIGSFVTALGALSGATSQEIRGMRRGSASYDRVITELLRGKGTNKTTEERVKEAKMISEIGNRKLTKDEAEQLLAIRGKELIKLRKDPRVKYTKENLTKEEFEDYLRDRATDQAKDIMAKQMGIDFKEEAQEEITKGKKEQEERQRMLKYKKK